MLPNKPLIERLEQACVRFVWRNTRNLWHGTPPELFESNVRARIAPVFTSKAFGSRHDYQHDFPSQGRSLLLLFGARTPVVIFISLNICAHLRQGLAGALTPLRYPFRFVSCVSIVSSPPVNRRAISAVVVSGPIWFANLLSAFVSAHDLLAESGMVRCKSVTPPPSAALSHCAIIFPVALFRMMEYISPSGSAQLRGSSP